MADAGMNANGQAAASFYDRMWEDWGALDSVSPAAYHRRRWILKLVRQHARGARVALEVGSGLGSLLKRLAIEQPALRLFGSDVSPASLETSRAACPQAELFLLDLDASDFETRHTSLFGRFDLIIASEVLEHIADDRRALGRLSALLAPGGHLIVTVPAGARTRFDLAIGHLRHYTKERLEATLQAEGFELERVFAWGFPFHTFYRLLVRVAARFSVSQGGSSSPPSAFVAIGYRALGTALKPLYYLNLPLFGDQLFAVVSKTERLRAP